VIFEAHSGIPRFPCLLSSKGVLRVNSPLRIGSKISLKSKMENNRISAKLIKPKLKRIPCHISIASSLPKVIYWVWVCLTLETFVPQAIIKMALAKDNFTDIV
jgi:hypothetical protein